MSFLTPLYLAGLLAVSLPVLFHMFRRTPKGRLPFSTVMFLQPSPPRITRRRRLENWPLLLLRALVLCLLAAAFARPFIRQSVGTNAADAHQKSVALLLDTSASMRRGNLWKQAVAQLDEALKEVGPADRLGVFTFDRQLRTVVGFEEWSSLQPEARREVLMERLEAVAPGWEHTDLGRALVAAADRLQAQTTGRQARDRQLQRTLLLITDLQAGSRLESLQTYHWPKDVNVTLSRVNPAQSTNAGLHLIGTGNGGPPTDDGRRLRVRVINAANSAREQFQIRCSADDGRLLPFDPVDVYVPPGTSHVTDVPVPEDASPAAVRLTLHGDDHPFDNTVFVHRPAPRNRTVLYVGDDAPDDPDGLRYYLERALRSNSRRQVSVLVHEADAPNLVPPPQKEGPHGVQDVSLIVVTDPPAEDRLPALRRFVHDGGTILAVAATDAVCSFFGKLLGKPDLPTGDAEIDGYAMLAEVDFSHPLFAPFEKPEFADFTKIRFWKHRTVDLAAARPMVAALHGGDDGCECRVLARFDDGDPALIEAALGEGTVLLLTAGWHPDDSQLARSSKFAPLLNGILNAAAPDADLFRRYTVGDPVPLAQSDPGSSASTVIRRPDDRTVQLASGEGAFSGTVVPGIYTVTSAPGAPRFSVSLAPEESQTATLPVDQLEALGVSLEVSEAESVSRESGPRLRQIRAQELESRQKMWRWLLVAAIGALILETWLAGRLTRRQSHVPEG